LGARNAIISDVVQLGFTWFTVSKWGLSGFVAGFVLSSLVGAALNLGSVLRASGLKLKIYRWFIRPLLGAALLWAWSGFLFRILERAGVSTLWNCLICAILGLILYMAALQAQGVPVRQQFIKQKGGVGA